MKFVKFAAIALVLPLLAGCALGPDVEATKMMPVKGSAFHKALHAEYVALAMDENKDADADAAEYFNKKAIDAAGGKDVQPTKTKGSKLPKGVDDEIEAARSALVTALVTGGKEKAPADSAKAQAMLDCWIHEEEEGDKKDSAVCHKAFEAALAKVEAAIARKPMAAPAMKKAMKPAPKTFVVYFDFNSSKVSAKSMAVIKEAAAIKGKQYVVTGHTDTSGSAGYNNKLADKRSMAVAAALAKAGIKGTTMVTQSFGKDEPAVKTGDKVKEPKNRRVTIVIP